MNKYFFESRYMVEGNEREINFYTQIKLQGASNTILWKYDIANRKLKRCFEVSGRITLWKYTGETKENELKYLGISTIGSSYIIGLNEDGDILFRYKPDGVSNYPVYDREGNIYIAINNLWMLRLSNQGALLWKWRPMSNHSGGLNPIKKYWIANEKLYVIVGEYLYTKCLDENIEEKYLVTDFNEVTRYEVLKDKLVFVSENYQELICSNFKGENLWRCNVNTDEMIFDIVTYKADICCLRVKSRKDTSTKLCVIDSQGHEIWNVMNEWNKLITHEDGQIVSIDGKRIVIYDDLGNQLIEHSYKGYIMWGRFVENKLIMLVESQGNIFIVECDTDLKDTIYKTKLSIKEQSIDVNISKKIMFWNNELTSYLLLNLETTAKYINTEIQEVTLFYEVFNEVYIQALTSTNIWISGMARDIPPEERSEIDRDIFKECSCQDDIVWIEFCNDCPKECIAVVLEEVCKSLNNKLGIKVNLKQTSQ